MNHAGPVFAMAVLIVFASCTCKPPISIEEKKNGEDHKELQIVGENVTDEQHALIKHSLACFSDEFRESVREVHLRYDKDHFLHSYGNKYFYAVGHNCVPYERRICIQPAYLNEGLVWHESTHVFTRCRSDEIELRDDWTLVAGDVYFPDSYEDFYNEDPSEGLMTQYGRSNYLEDIAEWVEHCYTYLYLDSQNWAFNNKHFKSDVRYRKKLALLFKYGFLSKKDYQKLKPLFE